MPKPFRTDLHIQHFSQLRKWNPIISESNHFVPSWHTGLRKVRINRLQDARSHEVTGKWDRHRMPNSREVEDCQKTVPLRGSAFRRAFRDFMENVERFYWNFTEFPYLHKVVAILWSCSALTSSLHYCRYLARIYVLVSLDNLICQN